MKQMHQSELTTLQYIQQAVLSQLLHAANFLKQYGYVPSDQFLISACIGAENRLPILFDIGIKDGKIALHAEMKLVNDSATTSCDASTES